MFSVTVPPRGFGERFLDVGGFFPAPSTAGEEGAASVTAALRLSGFLSDFLPFGVRPLCGRG